LSPFYSFVPLLFLCPPLPFCPDCICMQVSAATSSGYTGIEDNSDLDDYDNYDVSVVILLKESPSFIVHFFARDLTTLGKDQTRFWSKKLFESIMYLV